MLAYVFWHWPLPNIAQETYVDRLVSFHRALASNKPIGFQHSAVFQIRDAKWLETSGTAYEDWYLLDDSGAMDHLNDAAVSGECEEPHNLVAREAAGGIAGLYRLRMGQEALAKSRFATWVAKPNGVSYPDFYSALQPITTNAQAALWGRQMTLGPTSEFCIHSPNHIQLPWGHEECNVPLELIWSFA